jgi:hypothetical protein
LGGRIGEEAAGVEPGHGGRPAERAVGGDEAAAGPMVVQALDRIETGHWAPVDTSGRLVGYYYVPALDDFRAFYARGCRLI